jgi:hypothetical protein
MNTYVCFSCHIECISLDIYESENDVKQMAYTTTKHTLILQTSSFVSVKILWSYGVMLYHFITRDPLKWFSSGVMLQVLTRSPIYLSYLWESIKNCNSRIHSVTFLNNMFLCFFMTRYILLVQVTNVIDLYRLDVWFALFLSLLPSSSHFESDSRSTQ